MERKLDVELCVYLQACSKEKLEDWSSFSITVPQLAATVRTSNESHSSSSSSQRAGNSISSDRVRSCCWGRASIGNSATVLPFVGEVTLSVYAEAWPLATQKPTALQPNLFPTGSFYMDEKIVERGSTCVAADHQFRNTSVRAVLTGAERAGLILPNQSGLDSNGRIAPVPGMSMDIVDHVLVAADIMLRPVQANYPRFSLPPTMSLTRNLVSTLWCRRFEALGGLSSNPTGEPQHDVSYTAEMPPTELPTLAINFAFTVEVGLIRFNTCREAPLRPNIRDFAEVKDAQVDIAMMRAGISVGVGRRTSINPAGSCKKHV